MDTLKKTMNFNDVSIASVKGSDYRIHFWYMSKDDAINIMKKSDFFLHLEREDRKYRERSFGNVMCWYM